MVKCWGLFPLQLPHMGLLPTNPHNFPGTFHALPAIGLRLWGLGGGGGGVANVIGKYG